MLKANLGGTRNVLETDVRGNWLWRSPGRSFLRDCATERKNKEEDRPNSLTKPHAQESESVLTAPLGYVN